jgi:dihydroorotase
VADLTVIDPSRAWTVSAETLRTKSANTPLLGMTLQGRAVLTLVAGEVLHDELS